MALRILPRVLVQLRTPSVVVREAHSGFRSAYSLDKVHPNKQFDFSKNLENKILQEAQSSQTFHGYIPLEEIEISYSRSSGPGGQNVNKVNTKVDVRFNLDSARWIPENLRALIKDKHGTRITKDGMFYIQSEKTRDRQYNLADCLDKIRFLIRNLDKPAHELTAEEQAVAAKNARKAAQERLREKREQSLIKESRRSDYVL